VRGETDILYVAPIIPLRPVLPLGLLVYSESALDHSIFGCVLLLCECVGGWMTLCVSLFAHFGLASGVQMRFPCETCGIALEERVYTYISQSTRSKPAPATTTSRNSVKQIVC
jgi:hypothetical protein